jgi:hypothetical protein
MRAAALLLPFVVVAWLLKIALMPLLRRWPRAAARVERHWAWAPIAMLFAYLAVVAWPVAAVLAVVSVGWWVVHPRHAA